jgi:hypothetical protein
LRLRAQSYLYFFCLHALREQVACTITASSIFAFGFFFGKMKWPKRKPGGEVRRAFFFGDVLAKRRVEVFFFRGGLAPSFCAWFHVAARLDEELKRDRVALVSSAVGRRSYVYRHLVYTALPDEKLERCRVAMARDVVGKRVALVSALLVFARAGALMMSVVPAAEPPRRLGGRRAFFGGVAGVAASTVVLKPGKAAATAKTASTAATVSNDFISGCVCFDWYVQSAPCSNSLASGAAQRVVKDIVLHPIDTVKTRLQQPRPPLLLSRAALWRPYAGVVPPLVVGVPAGALFFGVKDALGRPFEEFFGSEVLAES